MAKFLERQPLVTHISDLQKAIDRLLTPSVFEWADKDYPMTKMGDWIPQMDIKDEDNQYVIHADLPGVEAKDIEVNLENGILSIKGHKGISKHIEKEKYVRIERVSGTFYRSVSLPDTVDASKIIAKCKNGVLDIIVPKSKQSTATKIAVTSEE